MKKNVFIFDLENEELQALNFVDATFWELR